MSRFTKLSTTTPIELISKKSACIVELQEGITVPEIVVQEMYWSKEEKWAYCKGGIRIPYNVALPKSFMAQFNEVLTQAKGVKPRASEPKTTNIADMDFSTMTVEQKKALIAMLMGSATETAPKEVKKPAPKTKTHEEIELELTLENFFSKTKKAKK